MERYSDFIARAYTYALENSIGLDDAIEVLAESVEETLVSTING